MKFKINTSKENAERLIREYMNLNDFIYYILGFSLYGIYVLLTDYPLEMIIINFILFSLIYILLIKFLDMIFKSITISLIIKISQKRFKTKYGLMNISITKGKYVESCEDYSLTVDLKNIKKVIVTEKSLFVLCKRVLLMFDKEQFTKQDKELTYGKLVERFKKETDKIQI